MSRLNEIMDNHENLDHLLSMLKHYAVSAEFVSFALIEQFKKQNEANQEAEEAENEEDQKLEKQYTVELMDDLDQFYARF